MSEMITPGDLPSFLELDEFTAHFPQLQIDTDVLGGEGGPSNFQGQVAANRTRYLLNRLSEIINSANQPNGFAKLTAAGKIPASIIGTDTARYVVVNNAAQRLALPQTDNLTIAAQVDDSTIYYLNAGLNPSVAGNWVKGQSTTAAGLISFNNRTGVVTAQAGDYTAEKITESDNKRFVSDAEKKAWNDAPDIIIKDAFRQAIEGATGGRNTVIYDAQKNPNVMVVIPKFDCSQLPSNLNLGTGIHPAFLTNGAPRSEILIAKYSASAAPGGCQVVGGEYPYVNVNFDTAKSLCTAKGANWHLMSNWEWAALALWCVANGYQPRGNTFYGRSHANAWETILRRDSLTPGTASGIASMKAGAGPIAWSHDNSECGVFDLVGNVWEWVDQLKCTNGQIIMTTDNQPTLAESNWTARPAYFDMVSSAPQLAASKVTTGSYSAEWQSITKKSGYVANQLLRQALIESAITTGNVSGRLTVNNNIEALPVRGGNWDGSANTGMGAISFGLARSSVNGSFGFRPGYFV